MGDLFGQLSSDIGELVSMHIDLAKAELKEDIREAGSTAGLFGAGAFAGAMTALALTFTVAWLLDEWMPTWVGFLIVTVIWGVAAAVLVLSGRNKAQDLDLVPQQTVGTVKEDVEWAKHQRS